MKLSEVFWYTGLIVLMVGSYTACNSSYGVSKLSCSPSDDIKDGSFIFSMTTGCYGWSNCCASCIAGPWSLSADRLPDFCLFFLPFLLSKLLLVLFLLSSITDLLTLARLLFFESCREDSLLYGLDGT